MEPSRRRFTKEATTNQRAAKNALQDCWDIVQKRPTDPEELAREALTRGDYVTAEEVLRQPVLSHSGPYIETLYMYILEYHVFHFRNKTKKTEREIGIAKKISRDCEEARQLRDSNWQATTILAYIALKHGLHKKADFLLFEALKFVKDQPMPYVVQSLLYQEWVPPKPIQASTNGSFRLPSSAKPTGSRDVESAEKLLVHATKLDKRMTFAHKCLATLKLQFAGDIEVCTHHLRVDHCVL